MKQFLLILLVLSLLPACAFAAAPALHVVPSGQGFSYDYALPKEDFSILCYSTAFESGRMVLYAADGHYQGEACLPLSNEGGSVKVWVETLKGTVYPAQRVTMVGQANYQAPAGDGFSKVLSFALAETDRGFAYSFTAPECDYLYLYYRNKQQTGLLPVYPDGEGNFSGEIDLPLTYARTLSTVQIQSSKRQVLAEKTVRKGYRLPPAPEVQPGRLSGLTVCIDPGHQENGQQVREPMGPGLEGSSSGTAGMAQGVVTLRREYIVTMEVAALLRDELMRQGATVILTKEEPFSFLSNLDRCAVANESGADIMLRLHCDTRNNPGKQGISVWGPRNSTYARAVADPATYGQMGVLLMNAMKLRLGYPITAATGIVQNNDQFVGNNWAKMICFLVEMGFMSNAEEDIKLATPAYQQMLAEGMAQGIYEIAVYRGLLPAE